MPRWSPRPSITAILAVGFGSLTAFAVGAVLLIGLFGARANTGALLRDKAELTIELIVGRIRQHLDPVAQGAEYAAAQVRDGEIDPRDAGAIDSYLRGMLASAPQLTCIGLVTPNLRVRRYDRELRRVFDEDVADQPIARQAMGQLGASLRAGWSDPFWSPLVGEAAFALRVPLLRGDRLFGALALAISTRAVSAYVDQISREAGLVAFVLAGREHVLAHPLLAIGGHQGSVAAPLPPLAGFLDPVLAAI